MERSGILHFVVAIQNAKLDLALTSHSLVAAHDLKMQKLKTDSW